MHRYLISILIFFLPLAHSYAQYDFELSDFDSLAVFIYKGEMSLPPPPPPPPPNSDYDTLIYKENCKKRKLSYNPYKVDTLTTVPTPMLAAISMHGRYNRTIAWSLKKVLTIEQTMRLDSIFTGKIFTGKRSPSLMCYAPHHTIFLYQNGKVIHHIDICFSCNRAKLDGIKSLPSFDWEQLYILFEAVGLPLELKRLLPLLPKPS